MVVFGRGEMLIIVGSAANCKRVQTFTVMTVLKTIFNIVRSIFIPKKNCCK